MKAKHWLVIVSHYPHGHVKYQDISRRGHLQYMRIIREQLLADRTPLKITASQQGMQMLFAVQPNDPDYAGHKRTNTCMDLMCSMLFKTFSNIKEVEIWGYSAEPAVQGSCCLWYYQWDDMEGGHLMTLPEELQTRIVRRGSVCSGYVSRTVLDWFAANPGVAIGSWDWKDID